ncbi:hypothetical protein D5086_022437 [Populus alba]|uniref:Uncharacterized protein n=1 Tax=Populus alba TaxID=43335 RepID=A0ACC4BF05_POPAL
MPGYKFLPSKATGVTAFLSPIKFPRQREDTHKFCNMGSEAEIPRKPSQGKSDVEGIFDPPYYEWFQFNKEFSEYTNFDECLAYIEDFMIKNGPFDGLLGFSQGAILSTGLPGLQATGVALTKVPKIKFLIIIGGAMLKSPSLAEKAYGSPIECPSLHFLGETDFLKQYGMELIKCCVDPVVIHHPKGHTIPRLDEKGLETMLSFVDRIQNMLLDNKRFLLSEPVHWYFMNPSHYFPDDDAQFVLISPSDVLPSTRWIQRTYTVRRTLLPLPQSDGGWRMDWWPIKTERGYDSPDFLGSIWCPAVCAAPTIRSFSSKFSESNTTARMQNPESISYLTQREAAEVDEILMGPLGFSVDQLMELAGLSVATSIAEVYKPSEYSRALAICGPGNNGGDGLVAARHLHHFGYKPSVCYPKRTQKPLYNGLVTQLESLSVPFLSVEDLPVDLSEDFDILVDAMFGFSFHGSPRPPFDDLIQKLVQLCNFAQNHQKSPVIVSVDIPSGWHVEEGDVSGEGVKPDMLVSLTAPKLCAKKFTGPHHFLGGRFVPPSIVDKFKLHLPAYPGTSMCVRIGKPPQIDISALRQNYISPELLEERVAADPIDQFRKWFDEALASGLREPNAMALSTVGKDGKPSSRIVLLKGVDKDGFVWYTNYESQKAHELSENPQASLLFYWDGLNRQVRVEGSVQKVPDEESEQYFHSRPRGSQIGAIASKQSAIIPGRHILHQTYKELEGKYSDGSLIPKPKHWGGYRLKPQLFEFWQGQQSRLHDRLQYIPQEIDGKLVWKIVRLAP